jgi:SAM-dependent methyltransferase
VNKELLANWLRLWRDSWRSLEGPELEPRLWHSHFLTVHHTRGHLRRLGAGLRGRVIDIGAGSGHGARYLNPQCTEYLPTDLPSGRSATDPSISKQGHAPLVHCSIYDIPYENACFDAAMLLNVLEHLEDPHRGLTELGRVLKPEAALLFAVPFAFPIHGAPHDFRRWTSHGLGVELQSAGFELQVLQPCGGTASSLALNLALYWRYEAHPLVILTPFLIFLQGMLNVLALVADALLPSAKLLPLVYVGLARKVDARRC